MHFENNTSFKQTVHPNNSEIKCFPLNACLSSGLFQTGNVQTKVGTMEQNVRWQESNNKHFFRIAGVHSSFERRVNITLQYLKNTEQNFQHTPA